MRSDRLRVLVLGYIVRGPLGGLCWHHLQYVLGLAQLGHEVWFFEDSDDYPSCYNPKTNETGVDPTYGLAFAKRAFDGIGLPNQWAYYDAHQKRWHGPSAEDALDICWTADLVFNVSGVNPLRLWTRSIPVRVFIDTDPAFTQIRHLTDEDARGRAEAHNAFFTLACNYGRSDCSVPQDGFPWQPTRQPVVLDAWPVVAGPRDGKFTTVMQWDSYVAQELNGRIYGMKSKSFEPFFDLPKRTSCPLELAIGSENAPREELSQRGWAVLDPRIPTETPWTYQRYIQQSKAEFSVAKHGYVISRSGWFSERSASYLASGRPVLVEDTGFSNWLDVGRGVLAFSDIDEARAGLEEINRNYERHCRWAREIITDCFHSNAVLSDLMDRADRVASNQW